VFSSARRGQVEPLPALLALAVFAIGLSLYGVTLTDVSLGTGPAVTDATMARAHDAVSEGPVVVPGRLDELDGTLPEGLSVTLRADGRTWRWGPAIEDPSRTRRTHVLVRTASGEVPGVLRVDA
jgi:hypothetical protein